MLKVNNNYLNLKENYLFEKISTEKKKYMNKNTKRLIDLSIGDVTLPLTYSAIEGIDKGKNILSSIDTFTGYPPSSGHDFLKKQIIFNDYNTNNISLSEDEIFISDSSKSDISHILELFSSGITVAIQDPVYPVYVDSNIISGNKIIYFNSINELIDKIKNKDISFDILYLCSPNNPTGDVINKENLQTLVDYAHKYNYIIFYDAAYEAFIQEDNIPHSIYTINNAKNVSIEFRSFSKTAGFTPLRLSYTVVPENLKIDNININSMFKRLKSTKYNGPSYLSEYAMYNIYDTHNIEELRNNIKYYIQNTKLLSDFFKSKQLLSQDYVVNSPYVWITTPNKMKSWDYFYYLLDNYMILGTPGSGFGKNGEYHFRFTGFGKKEDIIEAIERLNRII